MFKKIDDTKGIKKAFDFFGLPATNKIVGARFSLKPAHDDGKVRLVGKVTSFEVFVNLNNEYPRVEVHFDTETAIENEKILYLLYFVSCETRYMNLQTERIVVPEGLDKDTFHTVKIEWL